MSRYAIPTPVPPRYRTTSATRWWLPAYAAAVVYGTLYPWTGWRVPGGGLFTFAFEPWPRWWTVFDVATNVLVYVPLGTLLAIALAQRRTLAAPAAAALAIVLAAGASFALESLQSLLPGRVPSRLDVLANVAGAALGTLLAVAVGLRKAHRWQWPLHGAPLAPHAAPGLLLLCAWPIAQWYPQSMVFATGDVLAAWLAERGGASPPWWSSLLLPARYEPFAEAAGVSLSVLAVGLIARDLLRPRDNAHAWQSTWLVALPVVAAFAIKSVAAAAVLGRANAFGWLNAAAQGGLVAGAAALIVTASAGTNARMWTAGASIAVATVLFNVAPPNEYYLWMRANWGGPWANFHALLRALATVWPYAALAWCAWRLRETHAA